MSLIRKVTTIAAVTVGSIFAKQNASASPLSPDPVGRDSLERVEAKAHRDSLRDARRLEKEPQRTSRKDALRNVLGPGLTSEGFADDASFPDEELVHNPGILRLSSRALAPTDFVQGATNCYAVSSWQAIAQSYPGLLESAVHDNHDGSYTVTFFTRLPVIGRVAHRETIKDVALPYSHVSSAAKDDAGNSVMTMQIIEKAYSQWHGGYENMEWGNPAKALKHITGARSETIFPWLHSEDEVYARLRRQLRREHATVAVSMNGFYALENRLGLELRKKRSEDGTETPLTPALIRLLLGEIPEHSGSLGLDHCYSVVSVQQEKDADGKLVRTVTLRNPRSPDAPVTITLDAFMHDVFALVFNKASQKRMERLESRRDDVAQ